MIHMHIHRHTHIHIHTHVYAHMHISQIEKITNRMETAKGKFRLKLITEMDETLVERAT